MKTFVFQCQSSNVMIAAYAENLEKAMLEIIRAINPLINFDNFKIQSIIDGLTQKNESPSLYRNEYRELKTIFKSKYSWK